MKKIGAVLFAFLLSTTLAFGQAAPPVIPLAGTPPAPITTANPMPVTGTVTSGPLPAGTNVIGFVSNDPCAQAVKLNVAIATSSGNVQLVAPVAAQKVYICSLVTVGATASVQNIIEGTGGACTTANEAAVIGSTTAANGMSFAANGGFAYGNGGATVGVTTTAANGICLLQTGTAAIAGNMTYVQR